MAFWIRKKGEEDGGGDADSGASSLKPSKKKDDKKDNKPKRIDNLRIPQQLRITLRSLGSPNEYVFLTKDLSATGAFVLCSNFKRYPFQLTSTLLDCMVELKVPEIRNTKGTIEKRKGVVSPEQSRWLDHYNSSGYQALVAYGWLEAKAQIEEYLSHA